MTVSADRKRGVVGHYPSPESAAPRTGAAELPGPGPGGFLSSVGLAGRRRPHRQPRTHGVRGGDELMKVGLVVSSEDPWDSRDRGDFGARLFDLEAEETSRRRTRP